MKNLVFCIIIIFIVGCTEKPVIPTKGANQQTQTNKNTSKELEKMNPTSDKVDKLMTGYAKGIFKKRPFGPVSGWMMTNEKGDKFHRSLLMLNAETVIAEGRKAVPALLKWLSHEQMEIRYIANFSLQKITCQKPYMPYFSSLEHIKKSYLKNANDVWLSWYQNKQ